MNSAEYQGQPVIGGELAYEVNHQILSGHVSFRSGLEATSCSAVN